MIQILSAVISALSATIALVGAYLTWRNVQGAKLHTGLELARSLHATLVSPEIRDARDVLEEFRLAAGRGQTTEDDARAALKPYFAFLWCFEGILVGRRSLVWQRRMNPTDDAVSYLDDAIRWHVEQWVGHWPAIRDAIIEHIPDLDDRHSLPNFISLAVEVLGESDSTIEELRHATGGQT